jgi:hypothetical protein
MEQKMKNRAISKEARKAFSRMELRFIDMEDLVQLIDDVKTSVALSARENFSRLPRTTDPTYEEKANAGAQRHLSFISERMNGMIDEIEGIIDVADISTTCLVKDATKSKKTVYKKRLVDPSIQTTEPTNH